MSAASLGCYYDVIGNGLVETYACQNIDNRVLCPYYCYGGYQKTTQYAYCTFIAGNEKWIPSNYQNEELCIPEKDDQSPTTTRTTTWTIPASEVEVKTNYNYVTYGAGLSGFFLIVFLVLAICLRTRRLYRFSRCVQARNPVLINPPRGPHFVSYADEPAYDGSGFRDIASRIVARSGVQPDASENDHNPPPYETHWSPDSSEHTPSFVVQQPPSYSNSDEGQDAELQPVEKLSESHETDELDQPPPNESCCTTDGPQKTSDCYST